MVRSSAVPHVWLPLEEQNFLARQKTSTDIGRQGQKRSAESLGCCHAPIGSWPNVLTSAHDLDPSGSVGKRLVTEEEAYWEMFFWRGRLRGRSQAHHPLLTYLRIDPVASSYAGGTGESNEKKSPVSHPRPTLLPSFLRSHRMDTTSITKAWRNSVLPGGKSPIAAGFVIESFLPSRSSPVSLLVLCRVESSLPNYRPIVFCTIAQSISHDLLFCVIFFIFNHYIFFKEKKTLHSEVGNSWLAIRLTRLGWRRSRIPPASRATPNVCRGTVQSASSLAKGALGKGEGGLTW